MKLTSLIPPQVNLADGCFTASDIQRKSTTLGSLAGIFADPDAWRAMPAELAVYQVEMLPSEQQEGELFVGTTHLQAWPGRQRVLYDPRAFSSAPRTGGILFWPAWPGFAAAATAGRCLQAGTGHSAGSVHHIPSFTAHRLINTGTEVLSALAVWPTVAGHNYDALQPQGFKLRVFADGSGWKAEAQYE